MHVYSRYNPVPIVKVRFINSKHLTEQGLVEPLSKLIQRYQQGKEVPHLLGSVMQSVPFFNNFNSDFIEKFKAFRQIQENVDSTRLSYESSQQKSSQENNENNVA